MDYDVIVNGKLITRLNSNLVERQKLDQIAVDELIESHKLKHQIFEEAKATNDPVRLKKLAADFETLEFLQQKLWGFPQNRNFHRWFDFPKCRCPKIDNAENIGIDRRIHMADCPIHCS